MQNSAGSLLSFVRARKKPQSTYAFHIKRCHAESDAPFLRMAIHGAHKLLGSTAFYHGYRFVLQLWPQPKQRLGRKLPRMHACIESSRFWF
jgi:hypothetical protein